MNREEAMENKITQNFLQFLEHGNEQGEWQTDDILAALLPLFDQVLLSHDEDLVAPLDGLSQLNVSHNSVWYSQSDSLQPRLKAREIDQLESVDKRRAMQVIDREDQTIDVDEADISSQNLRVWDQEGIPQYPVYVTHYRSWEHSQDHHDQLTDIFSLGMLLASLATGLDFTSAKALESFADSRDQLHQLCPRLHPVVTSTVVRMTELKREDRLKDLRSIIHVLRNYRDQPKPDDIDFSTQEGFLTSSKTERRSLINAHLRDRLFDLSKRNRLLHFRSTLQSVNLTVSSVPLLLDYKNIRPEQLFTWQPRLADALANEEAIPLDRYLRFEDAPYLTHSLDGLRREANRERKEFGFSELRFVLAFFRWHNLKESPDERIHSPLLLLPIELVKKKGVRDTWRLEPIGHLAEVNPALRYQLKQLYDLDLPEAIDLSETTLETFCDLLRKKIKASEPAVELKKIDQPQIDLVMEKARKRLDRFLQRRRISNRTAKSYENIDYSYSKNSFQPLGLQLFLKKIKPAILPLEHLVSDKPVLRQPGITEAGSAETPLPKEAVKKRESYRLREGSSENPYVWDFDLCSLTLANFSYRKMSLVRDYNALLKTDRTNTVFDELFSVAPKETFDEQSPAIPLEEQSLIVPADPTQISSIANARSGKNLIIQGPPGTGKSQTITNLIADFVAQGKRVLFVCEKRAALDVVYQRLGASHLDELTSLIHDSQTDKKAFIKDLKATYERFMKPTPKKDLEKRSRKLQETVSRELETLESCGTSLSQKPTDGEASLRDILDRLVLLRDCQPELTDEEEERLPGYPLWEQFGHVVHRLTAQLREIKLAETFAETSLSQLQRSAFSATHPLTSLKQQISDCSTKLNDLLESAANFSFETQSCSLAELQGLSFVAESAHFLSQNNLLALLDPNSSQAQGFASYLRKQKLRNTALSKTQKDTTHWLRKLEPRDTDAALAQALGFQGSIMRFVNPAWWKLRKTLRQSYQFSAHAVTPEWSQILTDLQKEHAAQAKLNDLDEETRAEYGVEDLGELAQRVEDFKARRMAIPIDKQDDQAFFDSLLKNDDQARDTVTQLASMNGEIQSLQSGLNQFLIEADEWELPHLKDTLNRLEQEAPHLPEILGDLQDLSDAPDNFFDVLRDKSYSPEAFECACATKTLNQAYREDRNLKRYEGWMLRRHSERAETSYKKWMDLNGERIVTRVHKRFQEMCTTASKPAAQLTEDEKVFKKSFNTGRRELEHEFGKSMRYKSIRDLATGVSGQVVLSLKPIWLMSPLSISDTIPLEDEQFDVVIFDEASQIKLEEAIPAVQRAGQVIVVGDEMQLPPTNFFESGTHDEEESVSFEDEGEMISYDLSSDSFLTHSARTLASTMLGWHYRSRYEALIRFSNANFYEGKLLTIPDRSASAGLKTPLNISGLREFPDTTDDILSRSISFCHMDDGVYAKRQNAAEANYIAHLVRDFLNKDTGLDMGIVAFSEAQQAKIEEALSHLAREDEDFGRRLELEREREEDGQFCGLFVKNLENVQGDERDIMLLSICYAPDSAGKMRMNFGPINRSGGEKRLNVIFSRARQHMVIVSSIRHHQITNDYNDGAACLKRFLEYAAAVSIGDQVMASHVIDQSGSIRKTEDLTDNVEETLSQALSQRGYLVEKNIGDSQFTCDLALRLPSDENYRLGILIDGAEHYATSDPLERYVLRPGLLRAFGWRVFEVLAKDWYHDPEQVLNSIDHLMRHEGSVQDLLSKKDQSV